MYSLRNALPQAMKGAAVVIGNFDGVHRGHQAVLRFALNMAKQSGLKTIMLTFEPHPHAVFIPDSPIFRLSSHKKKAQLAQSFGLDGMISLNFTHDFSNKSPEWFINEVLLGALQVKHVIAGYDFHFGKDRKGSPDFLRAQGEHHDFAVSIVDMKSDQLGNAVSSTRIRQTLEKGDVELANQLLGYRHFVTEIIQKNSQLCTRLGVLTGRIELHNYNRMKRGIYAIKLIRVDGTEYEGLGCLGANNGAQILDIKLFNFDEILHEESVNVIFYALTRDKLILAQSKRFIMQRGVYKKIAQLTLNNTEPLSEFDQKLRDLGSFLPQLG